MANLPLTEIVVPGSQDVLELAPDLSAEVSALQSAVNTLNTEVSSIPNGTYPNLTAGSILTDKYDTDTTPYLYRAMPYVSKRLEEELVGGSVVWNQLAPELAYDNGWRANANFGTAVWETNKITYTITVQGGSQSINRSNAMGGIPLIKNHKYIVLMDALISTGSSDFRIQTMDAQWTIFPTLQANVKTHLEKVFESTKETGGNAYFGIFPHASSGLDVGTVVEISNLSVIDLTQMFGSTVADYVYTLEQATTGSGIAWLKSYGFFTKPYYEYDTGTLKSVNPTAHVTRGVNAWDEEWENGYINSAGQPASDPTAIRSKNFVRIVPNTIYYGKSPVQMGIRFYDENQTFIGTASVNNATFTTPTNAQYLKFYCANTATYKNDICINISDPTINGKYYPYEEHTYPLGDITLRGIPKLVNNELIYDGDTYTHDGAVQRNTIFRAYQAGDESLANALTDGTNTVVYSANASTETTDTFEQYQICETGGTEEYITTNDVPVGHDTKYFTDVIGNIEDIPAPPTADGTYTLKVTVSSGVPTYAWV